MTTEDAMGRRRYNVGARKIPTEQRDVAHTVITPEDDRGYLDVMGADGEEGVELDGEQVAVYSVLLTFAEADAFRAASNARYVEVDQVLGAATTAHTSATTDASWGHWGQWFAAMTQWRERWR